MQNLQHNLFKLWSDWMILNLSTDWNLSLCNLCWYSNSAALIWHPIFAKLHFFALIFCDILLFQTLSKQPNAVVRDIVLVDSLGMWQPFLLHKTRQYIASCNNSSSLLKISREACILIKINGALLGMYCSQLYIMAFDNF